MLAALTGYRTYLSAAATILLSLSSVFAFVGTSFGAISLDNGLTLGVVCVALSLASTALANIFQRAATANTASDLAKLIENSQPDIDTLVNQVKSLIHSNPPAPVKPDLPLQNFPTRDFRGAAVYIPGSAGSQYPPLSGASGEASPGTQLSADNGGSGGTNTPLIVLAFLLMFGGVTAAAPPVAIISGPRTAEPGEEVILDASTSEGDPKVFAWRIYPQLAGRKQLTVLEGGKRVRVASFPGRYLVRVMMANEDGISDHDHVVNIPGAAPCPPAPDPSPGPAPGPIVPTPTPDPIPTPTPVPPAPPMPVPPPAPDLPPGEFDGLPAAVKALAMQVVSPNRAAEAAKLADAFEVIAAKFAAGALTPVGSPKAIAEAFNSATSPAWDAGFRTSAIAKLRQVYDAGKLSSPDRWRAFFMEAAIGLRAVK